VEKSEVSFPENELSVDQFLLKSKSSKNVNAKITGVNYDGSTDISVILFHINDITDSVAYFVIFFPFEKKEFFLKQEFQDFPSSSFLRSFQDRVYFLGNYQNFNDLSHGKPLYYIHSVAYTDKFKEVFDDPRACWLPEDERSNTVVAFDYT